MIIIRWVEVCGSILLLTTNNPWLYFSEEDTLLCTMVSFVTHIWWVIDDIQRNSIYISDNKSFKVKSIEVCFIPSIYNEGYFSKSKVTLDRVSAMKATQLIFLSDIHVYEQKIKDTSVLRKPVSIAGLRRITAAWKRLNQWRNAHQQPACTPSD